MDVSLHPYHCPFTPWRPSDGRLFDFFSYDTETTDLDDQRPYLTPTFVLGAACDGRQGVFLTRDTLLPFFQAHAGIPFICHNAAFDLRVTQLVVQPTLDLYAAVEANQVWDTLILKRLYSLATVGHTARNEASLAHCAQTHLGIQLQKDQTDALGQQVRTSFGQFLGKPPSAIPKTYLTYLAQDAIATWHLFGELHQHIRQVLHQAEGVWGHAGTDWLREVVDRFGPLTHHVQLRASIVMDVLRANGIALDQQRQREKAQRVQEVLEACKVRMRDRGFLAGEKGSAKAMQSILMRLKRDHPDLDLKTTPSGKWSTAEEDLAELATADPFFADYALYKSAEKLLSTYLGKMDRQRLYPKFGYLLETGRTYCGGGFNLQNLPREKDEKSPANTIRGCFVPGEGKVFIDSDFSQIELVVLAYALQHQFGLTSNLAALINSGQDVHRLLAALMLAKKSEEVTKPERDSVKPVSFGRPGGMGVNGLQRVAKSGYGIDLTDEEVQQRIDAYHELCPELDAFLHDEVNAGQVLADALHLTPADYRAACGVWCNPQEPANQVPASWLGGMLLKVLRDPEPMTGRGRVFTPEEQDFLWEAAQRLQQFPVKWEPKLTEKLVSRQADCQLWKRVKDWAGRRSVFTLTGRLRAHATFCSARNCIFQGAAADGAILALWRVWRAGYKLVDFVHDQLVVEAPADEEVLQHVEQIEAFMRQGMLEVVPGMNVKVETVVSRSLNKSDRDSRYQPSPKEAKVRVEVMAA